MVIDTTAVAPALAAAKALAEQKRVAESLVFADFVIKHGDEQARRPPPPCSPTARCRSCRPEAKNLPRRPTCSAARWPRRIPPARSAPTANYVLGLATFLQIPDVDKDAEFNKSCELARKEEGLLTEAETAFRLGQSAKPDDVNRYLGYVAPVQAARRLHDQGVLQVRTSTRSRLRLLWCAASGAVAQLG